MLRNGSQHFAAVNCNKQAPITGAATAPLIMLFGRSIEWDCDLELGEEAQVTTGKFANLA